MNVVDDKVIDEILDRRRLPLPDKPRVVELKHEPMEDSTGNEAVRVWVLLDNRTPESQVRWKYIEPIEEAIVDAFRKAGVGLRPYMGYRTKAEHARLMRNERRGAS